MPRFTRETARLASFSSSASIARVQAVIRSLASVVSWQSLASSTADCAIAIEDNIVAINVYAWIYRIPKSPHRT